MPIAPTLLLAALTLGPPDEGFAIHLHNPPAQAEAPSRAKTTAPATPKTKLAPVPYGDDAIPRPPAEQSATDLAPRPQARKVGSNTTIFVNFDGVEIGECNPSNSHKNCHWLEKNTSFEPFSGDLPQRVAILDAMRAMVADYGIRVTGARPPDDEPYVMIVYGGDSVEEDALGRAPAGDCWDDLPNQIGYVFLDGERASWINGGAATAVHEAAHTWGLDHIGLEYSMMAPEGDNTQTKFFAGCAQIVANTDFDAGEGSCPELNLELCGLSDFQYDDALLKLLFGAPYVDDQAPRMRLRRPFDGVYYEGPASFEVELEVEDDLHPQVYELAIAIPGLVDEPAFSQVVDPSFEVEQLPLGSWTIELRLRDAAGNESSLRFDVEVGEEPVRLDDDGCACALGEDGPAPGKGPTLLLFGLALLALPRRKGPGPRALDRGRPRR